MGPQKSEEPIVAVCQKLLSEGGREIYAFKKHVEELRKGKGDQKAIIKKM